MKRRIKILAALVSLLVILGLSFLFSHRQKSSRSNTRSQNEHAVWYGFFYPGYKTPQTAKEKRDVFQKAPRFNSIEDCQSWGIPLTGGNDFYEDFDFTDPGVAAAIPPEANNGYICGLNCTFIENVQDIICEKKI